MDAWKTIVTRWLVVFANPGRCELLVSGNVAFTWFLHDVSPPSRVENLKKKTCFSHCQPLQARDAIIRSPSKLQLWGRVFVETAKKAVVFLGGGFNIVFFFHPENWGNDPFLTNIFQVGWNHHLVKVVSNIVFNFHPPETNKNNPIKFNGWTPSGGFCRDLALEIFSFFDMFRQMVSNMFF